MLTGTETGDSVGAHAEDFSGDGWVRDETLRIIADVSSDEMSFKVTLDDMVFADISGSGEKRGAVYC